MQNNKRLQSFEPRADANDASVRVDARSRLLLEVPVLVRLICFALVAWRIYAAMSPRAVTSFRRTRAHTSAHKCKRLLLMGLVSALLR